MAKYFDLSFDVERLYWKLDEAKLKHVPFALANALTITAGQAKDALEREIKDVFDRPTPYVQKSARFTRTSKKGPFFVYVFISEDKAKGAAPSKILKPHVVGGRRNQKRHEILLSQVGAFGGMGEGFTRPADRTGGAKLNQYGNLPASKYVQILSQAKAFKEQGSNANETKRSKARSKNRTRFFIAPGDRFTAVWERYGSTQGKTTTAKASSIKTRKQINVKSSILPRKRRPVLIFIDKANYEAERLDIPFVVKIAHEKNFKKNFGFALARAIRTAK